MHDTTRLARQGIPTATIVWDTFAVPAKTHARILGMPDLPMLVIPHLEPGETTADVRRRAEADAERIIELLTRGPEGTPPAASSGKRLVLTTNPSPSESVLSEAEGLGMT